MKEGKIDWDSLDRLRARFLDGSAGAQDYWQNEKELSSYDQTFAQRIGWKWQYVLDELTRRGWAPPPGAVLDWGCGTGIASRIFLRHFGAGIGRDLLLSDRSPLAVEFARRAAAEALEGVRAAAWDGTTPFDTLLLSHVLTELTDAQLEPVLELVEQAPTTLWVEPGTRDAARRLSQVRDRLRTAIHAVAPCTHQNACPMLATGNEPHWCHHFATPPPEVFMNGDWARFGAIAGIDLRSLPLSFLVMDKRPIPSMPGGAVRIIGRPRIYKGYALLLGCDASGLHERRLTKRVLPEAFRKWKKGHADPLCVWECEGDEIKRLNQTLAPTLSHPMGEGDAG